MPLRHVPRTIKKFSPQIVAGAVSAKSHIGLNCNKIILYRCRYDSFIIDRNSNFYYFRKIRRIVINVMY